MLSRSLSSFQPVNRPILYIGPGTGPLLQELQNKSIDCRLFPDPFVGFVNSLSEVYASNPLPLAIICREDLPNDEAYTFIRNLKRCDQLRTVPCILYRPQEGPANLMKGKRAGADDFYCGNFPVDDLLERIAFLNETKQKNIEEEIPSHPQPKLGISWEKRLFDVVFSLLALLLLSPLFLLLILLIRLESKGPALYISKRVGTGYRIFNFYKFRSMRVDADKMMAQFLHLNQYRSTSGTTFVKIDKDPRITRIGRFLRDTSLDELPQLVNVLKGDMSIVGNRPLPLYEAEKITKDLWSKRFLAPAGITGLWQVSKRGRKEMSAEERIALDMAYADECSLWYDIKIVFQTIPALLQKESV